MPIDTLEVELVLDDGKYVGRIKGAGELAESFARKIGTIDRSVQRTERRIRGFTSSLRDWVVIVGQSRNALNQIAFLTTDWAMRIVKTNAEIERMTFLLENMSKQSTAADRAREAQGTLNDLFDMAKEAPFSINAITDSMVKFKSVGLDPMDGSMRSLIDATAAFGGTDETLKRASIAIQQMAGKGVISMEELRQQLGEAVPQSIGIMARELGVTYAELVNEISTGNVKTEGALKAMFRGFEVDFAGRAESMMKGYNGQIARARTLLIETFTQNTGMENFFDAVTDGLRHFNDRLDSGQLDAFIENLGNGMRDVTKWVWGAVSSIIELNSSMRSLYAIFENPPDMLNANLREMIANLKEAHGWVKSLDAALLDMLGIEMDREGSVFNPANWDLSDDEGGFFKFVARLAGGAEGVENVRRNWAELRDQMDEDAQSITDTDFATRLLNGFTINPEDLDKAQSGFDAFGAHIREMTEELHEAEARLGELRLQQMQPEDPLDGQMAEAVGREVDAAVAHIEELRAKLRQAGEDGQKMFANLTDLESAKVKIAVGDWFDDSGFNEKLDALARDRAMVMEQIANNDALTAEQSKEARYAAEIEFVTAAIDANLEMVEISADAFAALGPLAQQAAAQAAAGFEETIVGLRERLAQLQSGEGIVSLSDTLVTTKPTKPKKAGGGGGGASKTDTAMENFAKEAKRIARESEEAFERMSDPFVYIMPDDIEKTREKLLDLAETVPALRGQIEGLMATVKETFSNNVLIDLQERLRDLQFDNMSPRQQRKQELKEFEAGLASMREKLEEQGLWRVEHEQAVIDMIAEKRDQLNSESAWGAYLNRWKSASEQIGDWMADTFEGIGDQLAGLIMSSNDDMDDWSARFRDFSRQVLETFLSMSINNGMSALMDGVNWRGIGSSIAGAIGGGGSTTVPVNHAGAILGAAGGRSRSVPSDVFATAPRFHTGGIIGSKEVPMIGEEGEGVFTKEQMKALGKPQAPSVQVNMINNSGQQIEAEPSNTRFDGEKMILDVVMKHAGRPGAFRNSLKG